MKNELYDKILRSLDMISIGANPKNKGVMHDELRKLIADDLMNDIEAYKEKCSCNCKH